MKKILLIAFLSLFNVLAQAAVQAEVDRSEVNADDTFRLTITQKNIQNGNIVPDLTPLRKDFDILGTARSMNYSLINGQSQSSSMWSIDLKAKKSGSLTIPALNVGSEQTSPISIKVTTGTLTQQLPSKGAQQQDIVLSTKANNKKPYVNQQIIYKVALYNSKQLLDSSYQGPQVENALVIPLGTEKPYQTQKDGVSYLVEEQNYAIFPQKSGPLTIKSPVFTALIYDFNPQRLKVLGKPIDLDVQPIPQQFTGTEWLPAKHVELSDEYEKTEQTLTQGNTLIRTVTLKGVGIPAQLLPSVHFAEDEAFNVYPEKGKEKNEINQGELISSTEIKVTYLFNKSGKITIPELKLPWFNTTTGKEEIAYLPAKTFEVSPSTNAAVEKPQVLPTVSNDKQVTNTIAAEQNNHAWLLAGLFALAWLGTLFLWWWQQRNRSPKGLYKKTLKQLQDACSQNNPQQARDSLLTWARLHWPEASVLNLADLIQLARHAPLKKQVQFLSQILYKNTETSSWRGNELWHSIEGELQYNNPQQKNKTDALPPMNPG